MKSQPNTSKTIHITLWIAQIVLALLLVSGTILKLMPIGQVSAMMPWTGQVPEWTVRALGVVDLLGALGLILPALLRISPSLTPWAAVGVCVLMVCAIVFHVLRGEASAIGINVFSLILAVGVAWGRFAKHPVMPRRN